MNWRELKFYGENLPDWLIAFAIATGVAFVVYYAHRTVVRRLRVRAARTVTPWDDLLAEILTHTYFLFLLIIALYLGLQYLDLPPRLNRLADRVVALALLVQLALWGNRAIHWWLTHKRASAPATGAPTTVAILGFIARVAVWALALLMILDNLGIDITALVAGLGIGGVAVALALQNILGDVFASLSIALDKPFVVGDFIVIAPEMGTVEYIGIKTTRLRSLSGEQIIVANADLLNSRIHNYRRMSERRIQFSFGVVYETPVEVVQRIPQIVRDIVSAQSNTRFDRAHFKGFGDSALDFEVVYYVGSAEYNEFMDLQQAINVALLQRFTAEGIAFAYPTRTLYVNTTAAPAAPAS